MMQDLSQDRSLIEQAGQLVRKSRSPHSPIWLDGTNYPAQYLIRQTRSLTAHFDRLENSLVLLVSIPLHLLSLPVPKPSSPSLFLPPISSARSLDFFLPDDIFLHLKLHKLKQIKHNMSTDMRNMQLSNSSQKTHHVQLNNSIVTVSNDEIRLSLPDQCPKQIFPNKPTESSCPLIECMFYQQGEQEKAEISSSNFLWFTSLRNSSDDNTCVYNWICDVGHLLIAISNSLYIYKLTNDGNGANLVRIIPTVPDHSIKLMKLYKDETSIVIVVGGLKCLSWILDESAEGSCHELKLFKENHLANVSGICIWSDHSDMISNVIITCCFENPQVGSTLSLVKLALLSSDTYTVDEQHDISLAGKAINYLSYAENSNYILGIVNCNTIHIWECPTLKLQQIISLDCSPKGQHIPASILRSFTEGDNIFVVICVTPPISVPGSSCCWLITFKIGYQFTNASKVITYTLPSNIMVDEEGVHCQMMSASVTDHIAAVLCNHYVVLWNIAEPHPLRYIKTNTKIDKVYLNKSNIWMSDIDKLYLFQMM